MAIYLSVIYEVHIRKEVFRFFRSTVLDTLKVERAISQWLNFPRLKSTMQTTWEHI